MMLCQSSAASAKSSEFPAEGSSSLPGANAESGVKSKPNGKAPRATPEEKAKKKHEEEMRRREKAEKKLEEELRRERRNLR
jgi:hypothetical protein